MIAEKHVGVGLDVIVVVGAVAYDIVTEEGVVSLGFGYYVDGLDTFAVVYAGEFGIVAKLVEHLYVLYHVCRKRRQSGGRVVAEVVLAVDGDTESRSLPSCRAFWI